MRTLYLIQSITCYGPHDESHYEARAKLLSDVGFIRCRSEKDSEGKYWEVWLGYDFLLAKHLLRNKAEVMDYLTKKVGPGIISVAQELEHWGASID